MISKHRFHSVYNRALYAFSLISTIMAIGTIGLHFIEKMNFLDAFYFMSMVATAQGPTYLPISALGKIFVALMSFISVGAVVGALGFLFGPFWGRIWHIGVIKLEEELHIIKRNPSKNDSSDST